MIGLPEDAFCVDQKFPFHFSVIDNLSTDFDLSV